MKRNQHGRLGFTLVELLTVIAIIGILAAMVMTVIPMVITKGKVRKAQVQAADIMNAIEAFDSSYGHFPISRAALSAANPDFTYGGTFRSASGTVAVGTPVGGTVVSNAEVMAMLMDLATFPGSGTATINTNHQSNPKNTIFLNATMTGDTSSPGVGSDLVYRDPWGNPYLISIDASFNDLCEDAFYRQSTVSAGGLNGLILQSDGNYAFHGRVMVWSAGPDGKVNPSVLANQGENRDNVLSWK